MDSTSPQRTIFLAILFLALGSARAHTNLGYPLPYSIVSCKTTRWWCNGTCTPIWGRMRNSPKRPAAVWKRGSWVLIVYHKNNHHGGFWRRSLVPVKHMFSKAWHKRGAFQWGCWSQGMFKCGKSALCGGDAEGRAFRTWMRVPKVFPNGDYVFVQTWYGGLHWRGVRPQFPDYTSCSFVRIAGGPTAPTHRPTFKRGVNNKRIVPRGLCSTGKLFIGECSGAECKKRRSFFSKPGEFLRGKRPPLVYRSWYLNRPGRRRQPRRMKAAASNRRRQRIDND